MDEGLIVEEGTPSQIFDTPQNVHYSHFEQGFIGRPQSFVGENTGGLYVRQTELVLDLLDKRIP